MNQTRQHHDWRFALRAAFAYLARDWRAGELRVIALALIIAVSAVSSVSFFTNRIGGALELQATTLLGGDLLLQSSVPIPNLLRDTSRVMKLRYTDTVQFVSVLLADDETQLVSIKAVTPGYPLRGTLKISDRVGDTIRTTDEVPAAGETWLESRLFSVLGVDIGDELTLGNGSFKITHVIEHEPDRSNMLFQLAPRVMINWADVDATGLISEGSRVNYQQQIAGESGAVVEFKEFIASKQDDEFTDIKVQDVRNGRPELRQALERADRFLGLTAIVCVLLAGAAVAVAAQEFASRQSDASAIFRTFGASQRTVFRIMLLRMALIASIASALGVLVGYIIQAGLVAYLSASLDLILPPPRGYPYWLGALTGIVCLVGFGLPAIIHVGRVPVLRVLQHELSAPSTSTWMVIGSAFTAFSLLVYWQARDWRLTLAVIGGLLLLFIIVALVAIALLYTMRRMKVSATPGWRFGVTSLVRRQHSVILQLMAFSVGLMALLLISIVGNGILNAWQDEIPADAPDHFAFNIQKEQLPSVQAILEQAGIDGSGFYPMVRARMLAINGEVQNSDDYPEGSRAQHLLNRDYNISYARAAPAEQDILKGRWWNEGEYDLALVSVEESIADTYDLDIGDRLTFRVAGEEIEAEIANIRYVNWDAYRPNFFIISTPGWLENQPLTYITSFRAPVNSAPLISHLVREVPGVTVLDLNALISRIRGLINTVSLAVESVLGFTLLAGAVVLVATVQSSRRERMRESALLKAIGAPYSTLMQGLVSEFVMIGAIAGLIAALIAGVIGWTIADLLFELNYSPSLKLLITGVVSGALGIGVCGIIVTQGVLKRSPISLLSDNR